MWHWKVQTKDESAMTEVLIAESDYVVINCNIKIQFSFTEFQDNNQDIEEKVLKKAIYFIDALNV